MVTVTFNEAFCRYGVCKPGEPHAPWCTEYGEPERKVPTTPPRDAIARLVAEAMRLAVENGANAISMPDHIVEVAAWLARTQDQE